MQQYTFKAVNYRSGGAERIRATAESEAIARAHLDRIYGSIFSIEERASETNAPHAVLGEIDCT